MIKSVFVCYCDWCGEEIKAGRKSLDVDGDITFQHDVCPKCYNKSVVLKKHFEDAVRDCHNSLNNINYIITRVKPFDPNGRNEKTAEEADQYIPRILEELSKVGDLYDTISIPGDKEGYDAIVREILSKRDS